MVPSSYSFLAASITARNPFLLFGVSTAIFVLLIMVTFGCLPEWHWLVPAPSARQQLQRHATPTGEGSKDFLRFQSVFDGRLERLYSIAYSRFVGGLFSGWSRAKYYHGTSHCGCLSRTISGDALMCSSVSCATRSILQRGFSKDFVRRGGTSVIRTKRIIAKLRRLQLNNVCIYRELS